jgi:hypothetical protein
VCNVKGDRAGSSPHGQDSLIEAHELSAGGPGLPVTFGDCERSGAFMRAADYHTHPGAQPKFHGTIIYDEPSPGSEQEKELLYQKLLKLPFVSHTSEFLKAFTKAKEAGMSNWIEVTQPLNKTFKDHKGQAIEIKVSDPKPGEGVDMDEPIIHKYRVNPPMVNLNKPQPIKKSETENNYRAWPALGRR